ncbi:hypothetical protein DsansV1_C05g0052671 [Dioscorea sansibarensis]
MKQRKVHLPKMVAIFIMVLVLFGHLLGCSHGGRSLQEIKARERRRNEGYYSSPSIGLFSRLPSWMKGGKDGDLDPFYGVSKRLVPQENEFMVWLVFHIWK